METSTEDITLCMNLNDSAHSPECTSALIDLWAELQLIAVEPSQAPVPNLFAFAETCLLFAVIMQNRKPEVTRGDREAGNALFSNAPITSYSDPRFVPTRATTGASTYQSFEGHIPQDHEIQQWFDDNNPTDLPPVPDVPMASNIWAPPDENRYAAPWQSYGGVGYTAPTTHLEHNQQYSVGSCQIPMPQKVIGIMYVVSPRQENAPAGEANIGIILVPEARGKGFAVQAGKLVLTWLFDELRFHRVQAGVLDNACKDWAITLFAQMGFVHEGTRRRAVFCPNEGVHGEWKDATHLALLETDWLMRAYMKPAPNNLWDEMFSRHAREREELLRWDEKQRQLKRTSSMETLRVLDTLPSNAGSAASGSVNSTSRAVTPSVHEEGDSRAFSQAPSDPESEHSDHSWEAGGWESDEADRHFQRPFSHIPRSAPVTAGAISSSASSGASHPHSSPESVPRSISPSSSHWDMVEVSSVSSSSSESTAYVDLD